MFEDDDMCCDLQKHEYAGLVEPTGRCGTDGDDVDIEGYFQIDLIERGRLVSESIREIRRTMSTETE